MKVLKFKSKKEFAKAIIKYRKLYQLGSKNNTIVYFDSKHTTPFRVKYRVKFRGKSDNKNEALAGVWCNYADEWLTKRTLQDKDIVWCWDNLTSCAKSLRIYNERSGGVFSMDGTIEGENYDNYKKANLKKLPKHIKKWAKEALNNLEE